MQTIHLVVNYSQNRDCPGFVRPYPSLLKACSNYTKVFTVDADVVCQLLGRPCTSVTVWSKRLCCGIGNGKIPFHVHLRMTILKNGVPVILKVRRNSDDFGHIDYTLCNF